MTQQQSKAQPPNFAKLTEQQIADLPQQDMIAYIQWLQSEKSKAEQRASEAESRPQRRKIDWSAFPSWYLVVDAIAIYFNLTRLTENEQAKDKKTKKDIGYTLFLYEAWNGKRNLTYSALSVGAYILNDASHNFMRRILLAGGINDTEYQRLFKERELITCDSSWQAPVLDHTSPDPNQMIYPLPFPLAIQVKRRKIMKDKANKMTGEIRSIPIYKHKVTDHKQEFERLDRRNLDMHLRKYDELNRQLLSDWLKKQNESTTNDAN
jgi:hypothetical protein